MKFALIGAALIAAAALGTPASAQHVITNPGWCAQFYPNANCQNYGRAIPIPATTRPAEDGTAAARRWVTGSIASIGGIIATAYVEASMLKRRPPRDKREVFEPISSRVENASKKNRAPFRWRDSRIIQVGLLVLCTCRMGLPAPGAPAAPSWRRDKTLRLARPARPLSARVHRPGVSRPFLSACSFTRALGHGPRPRGVGGLEAEPCQASFWWGAGPSIQVRIDVLVPS